MARFRLRGKHYLNLEPGTEWEQKETDQTGKQARKIYLVPRYLDPADPSDCNYPNEIIVTTKADRAFPKDLVFKGPPTADMEPLDDEAEKLLAGMNYDHPIESLDETYGEKLAEKFTREADKIAAAGLRRV